MFTVSNALSLLRAPLALLFSINNPIIRLLVVITAMLTDCIDGYVARKYQFASRIGAIIDPIMDKFFVFFSLFILVLESQIEYWQVLAMLSRDFFLCLFAIYLRFRGKWKTYQFQAIRWGKITTGLQFCVLMALAMQKKLPWSTYMLFIFFGILAFFELLQIARNSVSKSKD